VRLSEVCEFKYGKSLPKSSRVEGESNVFGSNGVVGTHTTPLTAGPTIVVGRKGSLGEVNYSDHPCWPIDTTYYVDETSTEADLRWLFHRLSDLGLPNLNRAAAIPGLNREDAYRKEFLLPPIEEQRRIAAILDHADTLRAKRREALARLDELGEAIYVDMFEARAIEVMHVRLDDVADISSGITKGRKVNDSPLREVPYLAVANVQDKRLELSAVKTIEATAAEIQRWVLKQNDLLLTEGGDPDKLGRGTLWANELPEAIHQNHVFRVRPDCERVNPVYLNWAVGSSRGKAYFLRSAKQTTGIASINMTQLKAFPLEMPDMRVQREFAQRVQALDSTRASHRTALSELDALFASLQSRAFRGEL